MAIVEVIVDKSQNIKDYTLPGKALHSTKPKQAISTMDDFIFFGFRPNPVMTQYSTIGSFEK